MDKKLAEAIGIKANALKHCDKLLGKIEKDGKVVVIIGATGVSIPVIKGDAVHSRLQSVRYQLMDEINSMEIVSKQKQSPIFIQQRILPTPVGASDIFVGSPEETPEERKKRMQREYSKRYYYEVVKPRRDAKKKNS